MSEPIYRYYERELTFIRQMAHEFARAYPGAAGRLLLEPNRSIDPHVERLIESFALLTGRIQHKIDDEFPELTEAILNVLYPHYLVPVPSCAVVQFVPDPARTLMKGGFPLPRHSRLRTRAIFELPCKYRTAYALTLWPIGVASAKVQAPPFPADFRPPSGTAAVLRLTLEAQATAKFRDLTLESLRFHLLGENPLTSALYEAILNNATQVVFRSLDEPTKPTITLTPAEALRPVGFGADEGLYPYPAQSFVGYRLLTEFFSYPAKFLFFDLMGLSRVCKAGYG